MMAYRGTHYDFQKATSFSNRITQRESSYRRRACRSLSWLQGERTDWGRDPPGNKHPNHCRHLHVTFHQPCAPSGRPATSLMAIQHNMYQHRGAIIVQWNWLIGLRGRETVTVKHLALSWKHV